MRSARSPNGRPQALPTEKRESRWAGKLSNARHPPQQKQLTSQSHHAAPPTDSQGTQQPPTAEEPKVTRPAQRTYPTGREKRINIEFRISRNVRVAHNNMRQRPAVLRKKRRSISLRKHRVRKQKLLGPRKPRCVEFIRQTLRKRNAFFDRFRSFSSTAIDRGIGIGRFGVEKTTFDFLKKI